MRFLTRHSDRFKFWWQLPVIISDQRTERLVACSQINSETEHNGMARFVFLAKRRTTNMYKKDSQIKLWSFLSRRFGRTDNE